MKQDSALERIRASLAKDRLAIFIGAGLSMPLFPSWANLLREMVSAAHATGRLTHDIQDLEQKIEKGEQFLNIADTCAEALGSQYRSFLETRFDVDVDRERIPRAQATLFAAQPRLIITTNYDRIPETLSSGRHRIYTSQNSSELLRALH